MPKVGGLCYDERTRKWKACAQTGAPAATGGETQRCCVNEDCCIDCEELNAIRICAAKNIQLYTETVDFDLSDTIDARQLTRQWRNMSTLPGGCSNYVPQSNNAPTSLLKNDEIVPCYQIKGYVNDGVTITPGKPTPVGIVFEANDKENCKDFAIFFLLDVYPFGSWYRWKLLATKYCLNYQEIVTENDFYSVCQRCPSPERCLILGRDNIVGGVANELIRNLGTIPSAPFTPIDVSEITIVVPECCRDKLTNESFVVVDSGFFNTVTPTFTPTLPVGPGAYDINILLDNPNGLGESETIVEVVTVNCGKVRIVIRYSII